MTRFTANWLSRAIVTKPLGSTIERRATPLVRTTTNRHHRAITPGCCYDRATIQHQQTKRNEMLSSTTTTTRGAAAFSLLAPNNGRQAERAQLGTFYLQNHQHQCQQRRFLSVGRQRAASQPVGYDDGTTAATGSDHTNYKTLLLTWPRKYVASVELNRPKTKNAFSLETADEFVRLFRQLDDNPSVRCVLLSGSGADFTSGVDIKSFMGVYAELQAIEDVAHRARMLRSMVERFQAPFKAMYNFGKPIICVQHGLSLGLAMELAACSDVRYCSRDTRMAIREVLIGIAADVGSLQLMPRLVANQSLLSELIYTGRYITMDEAQNELKFVSRVCDTKELALNEALDLASTIASRSPVAVQGAKRNLRFSREHPFEVGLDYNAIWNAAMMQGGDVVKAISAIMSKQEEPVEYDDL